MVGEFIPMVLEASHQGILRKSISHCSDDSGYSMSKTIQVDDDTYEALKTYKIGGLTFDDVIRRLMRDQDPEAFQEEYRLWQRRVLENMRESGDFEPL